MAVADGATLTVGVALLTVTLTVVVAVLKLLVSVGVKVTPWLADPAFGAVLGVVNAKAPDASTVPPVSVELANVCKYVMALAVGATLMAGVALFTVTLTVVVIVL
jgi:hypothetical protein